MKLSLVWLAVLAVLGVHATPIKNGIQISRGLPDDLEDFLRLIPSEEVEDLFFKYLSKDEDFKEAFDYILSDEFRQLVIYVENMEEVKDLLHFIQHFNLDVYSIVNKLNDFLAIAHINPELRSFEKISGGLTGFIKDLTLLMPLEKIEKLYQEKLETSEEFAAFVSQLKSLEFQRLVNKLLLNSNLQNLIKLAEAKGVDVQAIFNFLNTTLGLKFPARPMVRLTRNLKDDLNDLMTLIPTDLITDIFFEYLSIDKDFKEAFDYILSEEFKRLVTDIESIADVKKLLDFLQEVGLNSYDFINKINGFLGIDKIESKVHIRISKITGGLPGFIKDIIDVLPVDRIEELYYFKLENSLEFAELIRRLKSDEFQGVIDQLMANSKFQDLMQRVEKKGVDIQQIFDFFSTILGLKFPPRPLFYLTRNLKDDLNDLMALIPTEQLEDLFFEYLSEDKDFQMAVDYVLSGEFKSLVIEIEGMQEVKNLLDYLESSGLEAYKFVHKLNDLLSIKDVIPFLKRKSKTIIGGLPGFIEDVKALLPLNEIEALYKNKLVTSPDFAKLIEDLSSQEFQSLVDTLMANPTLQDLISRAENKGVDVLDIFDLLTSILGLKFPSRPLLSKGIRANEEEVIEILEHIWSRVPTNDIMNIVVQYVLSDQQFKQVVRYILSEEFFILLSEIENLPETRELFDYLESEKIKVYKMIDVIHSMLEQDKNSPRVMKNAKITGGITGLFKDIWALLPRNELREYFKYKRETAPKFREFVLRLETHELQQLVDTLGKHKGFNDILNRLENLGIDWDEVKNLITALIGIRFPERPL